MAIEVEAARGLVYQAALLADNGRPFSKQAAMAKLYPSEVANRAASASVQIHGGAMATSGNRRSRGSTPMPRSSQSVKAPMKCSETSSPSMCWPVASVARPPYSLERAREAVLSESTGAQEDRRTVDAHIHHWDPARVDWYPFLASDDALAGIGIPDTSAMRRVFDQQTYLSEAARWNVAKYVHVTTAISHHIEETREIAALAAESSIPIAIVGGIDVESGPQDVLSQLKLQQCYPQLRGVRVNGGYDHNSDTADLLLGALSEHGLVYDLWVHPDEMATATEALARFPALTVVVEHTGWPVSEDAEHQTQWRRGMATLAELNDRVHCKLSGLPMTLHRVDAESFRPWISYCLQVFGPERCFFASNFPVDGAFGSFDDLYGVYDALSAELAPKSRDALFAANAERVYNF